MRRINLAFTLLLTMLVISSCSKGSDDGEFTPSGGNGSLRMTIGAMSPSLACEVIAASQDGSEVETRFSSKWGDNATCEVWAKQSGELVYLGKQNVAITSSDKQKGEVNIDGTGKLDASKPYEVIGLGCSWRRDGNELYYRTDLHRGGNFGLYFKTVSGQWSVETSSRVAGTAEILYVINKTDKPVKFRHRGFDAEQKWYYTHAEVSIDKGIIVNTEQEGEAVSEEGEVPVFTGKNAFKVFSYYVPNGNKIQNAQLIAEIDGKEVRSENRISSDITLLTDHAYGIFAVWDGEKLTLGDGSEPEVIDLTDPVKSDISVVSLDNDGTMIIMASEENAPKVGDFLCSGPTEMAPYGYMLRVTEVKQSGSSRGMSTDKWMFIIKTTAAALNEVLGNFHYAFPIDLKDIKISQAYDNDGNSLEVIEETPNEWKIPLKLNLGKNLTITPEVVLKPKRLVPYIDTKDKQFEKFGADLDMDIDFSVQIDATIDRKFEKKIPLFHAFLDPITISAEPPIVLTVLLQIYLEFDADGHIKLSWVPIRNSWSVSAGAYYDFQSGAIKPNIGSDGGEKQYFTTKLLKDSDRSADLMEGGVSLNGSVSTTVGVSASVGINGCNFVGRVDFLSNTFDFLADMLTLDLWVDFTRKFSATLGVDNFNTDVWNDFHFNDNCKLEFFRQYHMQLFMRIWNPLSKAFWGLEPKLESKPIPLYDDILYPTLFVPYFNKIKATISDRKVILTAAKFRPYFWNTLFKEEAYGFRYGKYVNNYTKIKEWTDVPIVNEQHIYEDLISAVQGVISLDDLTKDCIYFVCPYSYEYTPFGTYNYFHRKGIYIRVSSDGTITFNELPNIPGVDL